MENLSESFSEESDPPPRFRPNPQPQYDFKYEPRPYENNYASTPTMTRAEIDFASREKIDSMPRENDSGLGLVELSMFPSAAGRLRGVEKQRESSPSASPPPSAPSSEVMYDYNDAPRGSFDQGSEML